MGLVLHISTACRCALVTSGYRVIFSRHTRREVKCLTSNFVNLTIDVVNVVFVYIRKCFGCGALVFSGKCGAISRRYARRERKCLGYFGVLGCSRSSSRRCKE